MIFHNRSIPTCFNLGILLLRQVKSFYLEFLFLRETQVKILQIKKCRNFCLLPHTLKYFCSNAAGAYFFSNFILFDTSNILFDGFHLASFQIFSRGQYFQT